jgi:hypothetical protein
VGRRRRERIIDNFKEQAIPAQVNIEVVILGSKPNASGMVQTETTIH